MKLTWRRAIRAASVCALLQIATGLYGQQVDPKPAPLTLREKYAYTLRRSFGAQEMVVMTAGAGLDQWDRHPDEWGSGIDAYGVRVASHFGQNLVKQHVAFAIRAIDHEDPRF